MRLGWIMEDSHKSPKSPLFLGKKPKTVKLGRVKQKIFLGPQRLGFKTAIADVRLWNQTKVFQHRKSYLAYYVPLGFSFGRVAHYQAQMLPKLGWNLQYVIKDNSLPFVNGWGLIHPVFYALQKYPGAASELKNIHGNIGGFDLADSDRISRHAVDLTDKMDLMMVPSECSKEAYLRSGVKSRVEVVPHGVDTLYSSPRTRSVDESIRILFFCLHSNHRKGADVVAKAMKRILKERMNVTFIVKGGVFNGFPRTKHVTKWLNEKDLVKLYDSCDIGLVPSRGGGFEMNALEMLTRGLVTIVSDWGAIQEYAGEYALTVKNTGKKVKPLRSNHIHCGYGADPDPDHLYALINYAIDNLESLSKKAEKNMVKIRKRFTWRKTVEKIMKCLEK